MWTDEAKHACTWMRVKEIDSVIEHDAARSACCEPEQAEAARDWKAPKRKEAPTEIGTSRLGNGHSEGTAREAGTY
jgi:hypothetical protein